MELSPIVLFVYNRPRHTRRTVEALQQNELAAESELFIYSDGPTSEADKESVANVREYVKTIGGFKKVTVVEQELNIGLLQSVVSGVSEIVNKFGRIIVVEDDLVSSRYFLSYMNDALERFERDDRVMHIAGYMYPIDPSGMPQTFFYRAATCWGWGTWKRAWTSFTGDLNTFEERFTGDLRHRFNIDGTYDYWEHIVLNRRQRLNTWAIRWYASIFMRGGLCLHPSQSLIRNIGTDNSGLHCGKTDVFEVQVHRDRICEFPERVEEDGEALRRIKMFLINLQPPHYRLIKKLGQLLRK